MSKYKKGDIVDAKVTDIQKYGAFVRVDDYYTGLIHISQMSDKFISDINDYFEKGDVVKVKIMDIDEVNNQLTLSIKDIEGSNLRMKRKEIKETVFGFYLLKKSLPYWIDKKIKEFDKKI